MTSAEFRFEYVTPTIRFGHDAVRTLDQELEELGIDRAMVVCGSTVGSSAAVMEPIKDGMEDRLEAIFDQTTPKKRLATAIDGMQTYREHDCDGIVGLGGGSSLDLAKVVAGLVASDADPASIGAEFERRGTFTVPQDGVPPVIAIPTTLAGADLSLLAGLTAVPGSGLVDQPTKGGISGRVVMPSAVCYDTQLLATTPRTVLAGSAMNGFDKGIETLYAANATPITDATASRGLERFREGLVAFGRGEEEPETYADMAAGVLLVQYGISRVSGTTLSIIHAFGHGLTGGYDVQQGAAHAIAAPHVLSYLFDNVDARRELLADALNVSQGTDAAEGVVDAVRDVRDGLGLPTQIRDVDGPSPEEFETVARTILEDGMMANTPTGLSPTADDIREILNDAW